MIKLLVADNKKFEDKEILAAFEDQDIQIAKQVSNSDEVVNAVKADQPDVVLMSLSIGGHGAFEAIDQLRMNHPRVGIVLMLIHSNGPFPRRLLETGASGFVSKNTAANDIADAIVAVKNREKYISPEIAQKIAISLLPGGEVSPLDRLSER